MGVCTGWVQTRGSGIQGYGVQYYGLLGLGVLGYWVLWILGLHPLRVRHDATQDEAGRQQHRCEDDDEAGGGGVGGKGCTGWVLVMPIGNQEFGMPRKYQHQIGIWYFFSKFLGIFFVFCRHLEYGHIKVGFILVFLKIGIQIGFVFGFSGCHFIGIGLVSVCHFPENDISNGYRLQGLGSRAMGSSVMGSCVLAASGSWDFVCLGSLVLSLGPAVL